jgi:adenylate cyclase
VLKFLINLVLTLLIIFGVHTLSNKYKTIFTEIENKTTDYCFRFRGPQKADDRIVIVDADQRSIDALGQWPWSRDKIAKIIDNLNEAGAQVIMLDLLFDQPDKSSPKSVFEKYNIKVDNAIDYDEILRDSIQKAPVVGGYMFTFDGYKRKNTVIPEIFFDAKISSDAKKIIYKSNGMVQNTPVLQNAFKYNGFANALTDSDNAVRQMPLFLYYQNILFPSFALQVALLFYNDAKVSIFKRDNLNVLQGKNFVINFGKFGLSYLNYKGKAHSFKYISVLDVYNDSFNKLDIKNKITLFGTSKSYGSFDVKQTPFDEDMPGVEIHATAVDNILNQNSLQPSYFMKDNFIYILLVLSLLIFLFIQILSPLIAGIFSLGVIVSFIYLKYYLFVEQNLVIDVVVISLSMTLVFLVNTIVNYFFESRQKKLIEKTFSKKVSPLVAKELIKNSSKDVLKTKEKEVSIFFSDIRNFTALSENMGDPTKLVEFLNQYMTPMSDIIIENQGTIDKYIGDAIMAYWNAPSDVKNHADKAVSSAILQMKALKELNEKFKKEGKPTIDIGIGINLGKVIVGEMGSVGRSDYTIIGDEVNLASRLEGLCKQYNANIIISQSIKDNLKNNYTLRSLGEVQVKGKSKLVKIYSVIS